MTPVQRATIQTIEGLLDRIPAGSHGGISYDAMHSMMLAAIVDIEKMPIDKVSRWVGYVQGVLIAHGHLDTTEERNRTRPFFHAAYRASDIPIPPTLDFSKE